MAEAERMILADQVILPVYNYVTKRLIDPRLQGWEENVMDHHLTRHMFLVKAKSNVETSEEGADVSE
jgi:oligopeptide transport system substrate-binding protein